jgi:hypothetical protein
MSLESYVASVLREDPVGKISFQVGMVTVDKHHLEKVAKAIESKNVQVGTGDTGQQLAAVYSSWKGRRWDPGEVRALGRITLGKADAVKSKVGRASIFHECVHALVDVDDLKVTMHNDEVAAYLSEAIYLRDTNTRFTGSALVMAIYEAAWAIVDAHKMLKRKGVKLSWDDCDELRTAIKAHPSYQ